MADTQQILYLTIDDYNRLPEGARTELIKGRFYNMAAPNREHQRISGELFFRIKETILRHGGDCEVYAAPFDVFLEDHTDADEKHWADTVVQPDISVICDKDKLNRQGCKGAPDWVIEIVSPGDAAHDYDDKLHLYRANGVREYWIVDPAHERTLVYDFEGAGDNFVTIYGFSDTVPVRIYDKFEIDFAAFT